MKNEYLPDYAIHPGEILEEELDARKITISDIIFIFDLTPNIIYKIIHEKMSITVEIAKGLEELLDISSIVWINLQKNYDDTIKRLSK